MDVDARDIYRLERTLERLNKRGIPFAIKSALNYTAAMAAKYGKEEANDTMVMRNKYSTKSIIYTPIPKKEYNVNRMQSEAGSVQQYMADQEHGFTNRSTGKHGVPVPTSAAAGQQGAVPRTRVIKDDNKIKNLKLINLKPRGGKWKSTSQRIAATIRAAVTSGNRYAYLTVGNTSGIWRILGGRRLKSGRIKGAKFRLLHAMDDKVITVKAHKWLEPASIRAQSELPKAYENSLNKQIERAINKA